MSFGTKGYAPIDNRITIVVKTADEIVNNSATLQNDDELFLPVKANTRYYCEAYLKVTSGSTPDIDVTFTVPSGATGGHGVPTVNNASAFIAFGTAKMFGTDGTAQSLIFYALLTTSSTTGNIQLQWAQDTANVSNTTVHDNSCLILYEIGTA